MELVKRLKGSKPEEVNYDFEEHYLHEDEETSKRKKGTLFTIIALIVISVLGYFGYKNLNKKEIKTVETNTAIVNLPKEIQKKEVVVEEVVEVVPSPILVKKEIEPTPLKSEVLVQKEVSKSTKTLTYTEVLAQELQPVVSKTIEIQPIEVKPIVIKEKIQVATPVKKITKITKPKAKKVIAKKVIVNKIKPKKIKSTIVTRKTRVIRIRKGDTLNVIAQRYYGNSKAFKTIIRANKSIRSQKTPLKLGQKIIVPYLAKNRQRRMVIVKKGYSLAYISKKFYGSTSKIQKIVNANYNIKNKNSTLSIGQKIHVPR